MFLHEPAGEVKFVAFEKVLIAPTCKRNHVGEEERGGGGKGWWRDGSHAKPPEAAHHIIGTGKKSALY